ncbi:AmmeMemoRadiSam system protein B [Nanoarchaeota archaeon]
MEIRKRHIVFMIVLLIIFLIIFTMKTDNDKKKVRASAVSGTWYPGSETELKKTIKGFLNNTKKVDLGRIKAIIVPHAGYAFSGQVAATAYKQVEKEDYKTVIIIGPSHYEDFIGASLPNYTHYETPLGEVKISDKVNKLSKEKFFQLHPGAHDQEHSLEMQIPFIQTILPKAEIIPILIGASTNTSQLEQIANTLKEYVDDKTLIVISSDFTHYGPNYGYVPFSKDIEESLKNLDLTAVKLISDKNPDAFLEFIEKTGCTICGRQPITILMNIVKEKEIKSHIIYYTTSGELTGDHTNSVSYVTMAFSEKSELLTLDERKFLLKLARDTIQEYLKTGNKPKVDKSKLTPALKKVQGCFVTLNIKQDLRGCIGTIIPQEELYKCVINNAINAAVNDGRFPEVELDELKDIKIEISVLTIPKKIDFKSGEDLKKKLTTKDGVILKQGPYQSTYLPQVWEQLADPEEFLSSLCIKGNMDNDCWKDTKTEVSVYQAYVFEED